MLCVQFVKPQDSFVPLVQPYIKSVISLVLMGCVNVTSTQAKRKPQGARTICLCSRLLYYSKCSEFTVCLTYSDMSLTMYINQ